MIMMNIVTKYRFNRVLFSLSLILSAFMLVAVFLKLSTLLESDWIDEFPKISQAVDYLTLLFFVICITIVIAYIVHYVSCYIRKFIFKKNRLSIYGEKTLSIHIWRWLGYAGEPALTIRIISIAALLVLSLVTANTQNIFLFFFLLTFGYGIYDWDAPSDVVLLRWGFAILVLIFTYTTVRLIKKLYREISCLRKTNRNTKNLPHR